MGAKHIGNKMNEENVYQNNFQIKRNKHQYRKSDFMGGKEDQQLVGSILQEFQQRRSYNQQEVEKLLLKRQKKKQKTKNKFKKKEKNDIETQEQNENQMQNNMEDDYEGRDDFYEDSNQQNLQQLIQYQKQNIRPNHKKNQESDQSDEEDEYEENEMQNQLYGEIIYKQLQKKGDTSFENLVNMYQGKNQQHENNKNILEEISNAKRKSKREMSMNSCRERIKYLVKNQNGIFQKNSINTGQASENLNIVGLKGSEQLPLSAVQNNHNQENVNLQNYKKYRVSNANNELVNPRISSTKFKRNTYIQVIPNVNNNSHNQQNNLTDTQKSQIANNINKILKKNINTQSDGQFITPTQKLFKQFQNLQQQQLEVNGNYGQQQFQQQMYSIKVVNNNGSNSTTNKNSNLNNKNELNFNKLLLNSLSTKNSAVANFMATQQQSKQQNFRSSSNQQQLQASQNLQQPQQMINPLLQSARNIKSSSTNNKNNNMNLNFSKKIEATQQSQGLTASKYQNIDFSIAEKNGEKSNPNNKQQEFMVVFPDEKTVQQQEEEKVLLKEKISPKGIQIQNNKKGIQQAHQLNQQQQNQQQPQTTQNQNQKSYKKFLESQPNYRISQDIISDKLKMYDLQGNLNSNQNTQNINNNNNNNNNHINKLLNSINLTKSVNKQNLNIINENMSNVDLQKIQQSQTGSNWFQKNIQKLKSSQQQQQDQENEVTASIPKSTLNFLLATSTKNVSQKNNWTSGSNKNLNNLEQQCKIKIKPIEEAQEGGTATLLHLSKTRETVQQLQFKKNQLINKKLMLDSPYKIDKLDNNIIGGGYQVVVTPQPSLINGSTANTITNNFNINKFLALEQGPKIVVPEENKQKSRNIHSNKYNNEQ